MLSVVTVFSARKGPRLLAARIVTCVAAVLGRTRPHSENARPCFVTDICTGQLEYSGLGLPLTYSRPVWKPIVPPRTLAPGAPPSGSLRSRYCEQGATRGVDH